MLRRTVIIAILALSVLASCGNMPIKGRVVDSVTGKPIEGAVVVAEWTKRMGVLYEMHTLTYKVEETVTDADGGFSLSGTLIGSLNVSLSIYKRGYVCWNSKSIFMVGPREGFEWKTGQTYSLVPWQEGWSHGDHMFFLHSVADGGRLLFDESRPEELQTEKELYEKQKNEDKLRKHK